MPIYAKVIMIIGVQDVTFEKYIECLSAVIWKSCPAFSYRVLSFYVNAFCLRERGVIRPTSLWFSHVYLRKTSQKNTLYIGQWAMAQMGGGGLRGQIVVWTSLASFYVNTGIIQIVLDIFNFPKINFPSVLVTPVLDIAKRMLQLWKRLPKSWPRRK